MKIYRYKTFLAFSIIIWFSLQFSNVYTFYFNNTDLRNESLVIHPQAIDRTGKVFSNLTTYEENCYIDRDNPGLNNQPDIYIPNYNISHATLQFENIYAVNYTKNIEIDSTEFMSSSLQEPTYVYQKFYVETDQYVNNVSIFIQDINDPTVYTEENSWEVAILNCSDDIYGSPDEELGEPLIKPHPLNYAAHWEVFDFKNSDNGPIFLNTSRTNSTTEGQITKYWFAFRVKIPPSDDMDHPKFLYFNPDGGDIEDIGMGDTFKMGTEFKENFSINHVQSFLNDSNLMNGETLKGNLDSFQSMDNNRYIAQAKTNNLTLSMNFTLANLSYGWSFKDLVSFIETNITTRVWWRLAHYFVLYTFDIYLAINVSASSDLIFNRMFLYNWSGNNWFDATSFFNITKESEELGLFQLYDPNSKYDFMKFFIKNDTNTVQFAFKYNTSTIQQFDVSINQFTFEVHELLELPPILPFDPMVSELYYPNSDILINATGPNPFGTQDLDTLKLNDDEYYWAQADTNNLSIEFTFNLVPFINFSDFDKDIYDWIFLYPDPIIPAIDFRVSSNVSIESVNNLTYAALELFVGDADLRDIPPSLKQDGWIPITGPLDLANADEVSFGDTLYANVTWIFVQLMKSSGDNSIKVRFRYNGTANFNNFNVTIDEVSFIVYTKNAISSDLTSKIGFGIKNSMLKPSDIYLQNFGKNVLDNGYGKGVWEGDINDAMISLGFFVFNVTSLWPAIRFDVNITYEVFKIIPYIEFIDNPASQYMMGYTLFSVRVTEANGKPLSNFEIIFELLNANNNTVYDTTAISNEEGIATASLNFENTGKRFSIRARYAEEGLYTSEEVYSGYIRVVNDYIIFMDNFLRVLPYIIIGLAAIVSVVAVRQYRHIQLRKSWAREAMILDDLIKTSHIMIIHKDVGVSIYDKQISLDIDVDLISGFLQAISAFKSEIKKEKEESIIKGKGFEMDYYDFKIVITDGDYIRTALILDGIPSEKLKENQWAFTEHFEKRFEDDLKDFTGDITSFRKADDLIERYFNISLVYPLQLGKHYEVIKVKGLDKALLEVAEQIQKERKFFFISSLLNFALAGRKASRDEIISVIIDLKRKGLIIPANIE